MRKYGFVRVASANHEVRLADVDFNKKKILEIVNTAQDKKVDILVFPELNLTGYTCMDVFNSKVLSDRAKEALKDIAKETKGSNILFTVGLPLSLGNRIYDVVAVVNNGKIAGYVPKKSIDSSSPYERQFSEFRGMEGTVIALDAGEDMDLEDYDGEPELLEMLIEENLIFKATNIENLTIAVEVGCDAFHNAAAKSRYINSNVTLVLNPSAIANYSKTHFTIKDNAISTSKEIVAGYVSANAGYGESTSDNVFTGELYITENGKLIKKGEPYKKASQLAYNDIDTEKLTNLKKRFGKNHYKDIYEENIPIPITLGDNQASLERKIPDDPFLKRGKENVKEQLSDIFAMMSMALETRIETARSKKIVLGVSGGLDSTMALLVAVSAVSRCDMELKDIIAISMPGFGTSSETYTNARMLIDILGVTYKEIPIAEVTKKHFEDIGHDINNKDTVYENAQSRERTQILLDYANMVGGIVLGTGDLSEDALGYCTFGGDHLYNYNVNGSLPKTLIKEVISYVGKNSDNENLEKILRDIVTTPISAELLPLDEDGNIVQRTEELIGPYELHDFFIYNLLYYSFSPSKTYYLAKQAFSGKYANEDIKKYFRIFIERFFSQQFKRQSAAEYPQVTNVSLSQRGAFSMSTQMDKKIWLEDLDKEE